MPVMTPERLAVVRHGTGHRLKLVLAALLALVAAVLAGFLLGTWQLGIERQRFEEIRTERDIDQRRAREMAAELAELRLRDHVEQAGAQEVRELIAGLHAHIAELEDALGFYRGLMSVDGVVRGLRVEHFKLHASADPRVFDYRLLLAQVGSDKIVEGSVSVELHGTKDGAVEVVYLSDVEAHDIYPLPFRLRYFQEFSGRFSIPEGFRPMNVGVKAASSKGGGSVQRSFEWIVEG